MKRTTIFADESLIEELKEISEEEQISIAEIIRTALREFIRQKRKRKNTLSFAGVGKSGRKDISERHEELLWEKPTN